MSKIAFICDENLKSLFEGFGIDSFVLDKRQDIKSLLDEIIDKGYRIIYILEKFTAGVLERIDSIRAKKAISIVVVPDHLSELKVGLSMIKQATVDATGADAIFTSGDKT